MLYALTKPHLQALLVAILCLGLSTFADDNNFAKELHKEALAASFEEARRMLNDARIQNELGEKNGSNLLVFVSSSMPVSLLKSYAMEAAKYNGTLVFKGLPGGSFLELSKIINEIYEGYDETKNAASSCVIDDEAFARFGITSVPSFVLVKTDPSDVLEESVTYDKIVGNIGIRAALEKISETGEFKEEAVTLLKGHHE